MNGSGGSYLCFKEIEKLSGSNLAVITSRTDAEYTTRVLLEEIEFYPYGVKCEKYPLISVLSDGFVPPLPD